MAFGMTFALSAGEIDLSIGQVVGLSAMVTAVLLRDANMFVAVPAAPWAWASSSASPTAS